MGWPFTKKNIASIPKVPKIWYTHELFFVFVFILFRVSSHLLPDIEKENKNNNNNNKATATLTATTIMCITR